MPNNQQDDSLKEGDNFQTPNSNKNHLFYEQILNSIVSGVWVVDKHDNFVFFNKAMEKISGVASKDIVGSNFWNLPKYTIEGEPNFGDLFQQAKKSLQMIHYHMIPVITPTKEISYQSGALMPSITDEGVYNGIVCTVEDMTKEKQEEQIRIRTQKLESLSLLAGGIAHDFNNILVGILGNVNLLQLEENLDDDFKDILDDIERATYRANKLANQILTFSKGGKPIKKPERIEKIIKEVVTFSTSGSNIETKLHISKALPMVNVDNGQIFQVLNNLILNAIQSMPQGGIVDIFVQISDFQGKSKTFATDQTYIRVDVQDHGCGIPLKYQDSIFTPYFSTKTNGNGLGLATAYSIIKNHDGSLFFESTEENGSKFTFLLPASTEEFEYSPKFLKEVKKYNAKALIMDDDPVILSTLEKLLVKLGISSVGVSTGQEVVELYQKSMDSFTKFDFVILDLTIKGGIGGELTLHELKKIDPMVVAIVSSGYSNDPIMSNYQNYGFAGVLQKPYSIQKILECLSKLF